MKRVLFIDYCFPPLAGDWRGMALARFLPEFGWQPIVISATESLAYDKEYTLLQEVPEETEVHRAGHREPMGNYQKYGEWCESFPQRSSSPCSGARGCDTRT